MSIGGLQTPKPYDIAFIALSGIAVALLVASFLVPPTGVIDGSVLAATGEIFAFAALGALMKAIDKGVDATIAHKDTKITINNDNK